jgi:hypothetical protein
MVGVLGGLKIRYLGNDFGYTTIPTAGVIAKDTASISKGDCCYELF